VATGLWTSAAGAAAQAQSIDIVANNLANVDTLGFKKDAPTFKEYLSVVERDHDGGDIPRGPIKEKEFYPLDGRDQAYVVMDGTYTNFKPGTIRVTQSPLDVALDGPGFLEVSTPNGIRYTKQGSLKMAMDGRLVTSEGYPVLSASPLGVAGVPPQAANVNAQPGQGGLATQGGVAAERFINLRDRTGALSITQGGDLYMGEDLVAKLSVSEFQDPRKLRKVGSALFENKDLNAPGAPAQHTTLRQGMVETSNVNPIEEMTNLIKGQRLFEHDLKAMKTYDSLLQKEANDIGKL
jgi:flagellar basal-body rod protein FlgG